MKSERCKLCSEQPLVDYGEPRRCAFMSGVFSSDNWNCLTLNGIRNKLNHGRFDDDEWLASTYVDFVADPDSGEQIANGYLVLQGYKNRGRVQSAAFFATDEAGLLALTKDLAEVILALAPESVVPWNESEAVS